MSYEKEINDFIADEQIPYRTMFFYKGIFRDKLVAKDFESLFHKFYDATRIAFMDGKKMLSIFFLILFGLMKK